MILRPLDIGRITARTELEGMERIGGALEPVGVVHAVGHGYAVNLADTSRTGAPCEHLPIEWEVGGNFPNVHDVVTQAKGDVGGARRGSEDREFALLHLEVDSAELNERRNLTHTVSIPSTSSGLCLIPLKSL